MSGRRSDTLEGTGAAAAFAAFRRSAGHFAAAFRTRSGFEGSEGLAGTFEAALGAHVENDTDAVSFFENNFRMATDGRAAGSSEPGLMTGYYEPELPGSLVRTSRFSVPLLAVPNDLVAVEGVPRTACGGFARRGGGTDAPYHDREAIDRGALDERGLELLFVEDPVDAFFVHVQGSARIVLPDGSPIRIGYAAKNGHPFTAIGRLLVDRGEIAADTVSMQTIKAWLRAHPDRRDEILWANRSYIFFRILEDDEPEAGPIGAGGVALEPGASVAADERFHRFGTPLLIETLDESGPFRRRLVIAQDAGSAIAGHQRIDLFCGSGNEAGERAGGLKTPIRLTALHPRVEGRN